MRSLCLVATGSVWNDEKLLDMDIGGSGTELLT